MRAAGLRPGEVVPDGRKCTKCGAFKPLTAFGKKKGNRFGVKARCKQCLVADQTEYAQKNRDRISAYHKAWSEKNAERRHQYNVSHYQKNRELRIAQSVQWIKDNRETFRARATARKSRMRKPPAWADLPLIADIYRYARTMRECGIDCHVDHVIPMNGKTVSGLHVHQNLTVLLAFDNISKGAKFNG